MEPAVHSKDVADFVTIIGSSMADIANAASAQGLAKQDFSIVHKIGRHRVTVVRDGKAELMFGGEQLIAATFARRPSA